ncbi:MAG: alginate lyase family protein [Pyrinomonadaceae bacterium]
MSNPLEKIKKLKGRSWTEIRTRGKQTISAYAEQIGLSGNLPTDDELRKLVDRSEFSDGIITAEALYRKFYENGSRSFFPSFKDSTETIEAFCDLFGENAIEDIVSEAAKISNDKFDLLGFKDLDFGDPIDWHYEPLSDIQAPMQHWKLFDDLDTKSTGDKKIIWELNRHQHFFKLGAAYLYTKDERYASVFVRHLHSWMEQNPPGMGINWASSLEVSFRAMSWLWAFHFFKDSPSFTPGVFQKALKYLFLHGMHIEQYLSTYYSPNTHLTGEALGLYYLGTQLPFLEHGDRWRSLGKKLLLKELDNQILEDGVYFEQSTWYQKYTADFCLHFLILSRLNGDDAEKALIEKFESRNQSLLDFMMFATRPDGSTPLIGDDDGGRCLPLTTAAADDFRGSLALGAVVFNRGDLKYVSKGVSQEVLWLLGVGGVSIFNMLESFYPETNSMAFRNGGYFIMRDGWTETDNYLMFDAGDIGSLNGGHGHADTLSFQLSVGGNTMLIDPGTYTYHKSKELRDYFRSSEAHNTLTIDNRSSSEFGGKFSWETRAEPNLEKWHSHDRFDFVEASHDGYAKLENISVEHSRSILFLKNEYWIMRDFVKALGNHRYQQNFHFDAGRDAVIACDADGKKHIAVSGNGDPGLDLFTFGDDGMWCKREGWSSKAYGSRESAPFLQFLSKGTGPQEFFTFMLPRETGFEDPRVMETTVAGGRAFVINYRDYQDLFVFADGATIRTEFFNTDFRFLWARLSSGDQLPEEFVMIGGTNFSLNGRVVIRHPKHVEYATARRFGNKLHVRTESDIFSVSLPQNKTNSYILKTPTDV